MMYQRGTDCTPSFRSSNSAVLPNLCRLDPVETMAPTQSETMPLPTFAVIGGGRVSHVELSDRLGFQQGCRLISIKHMQYQDPERS